MDILPDKNKIQIGDLTVPIEVAKGRINRIRLSFTKDQRLKIETGTGTLQDWEKNFLLSRKNWIAKKYRSTAQLGSEKKAFLQEMFTSVPLMGIKTQVVFEPSNETRFRFVPDQTDRKFVISASSEHIENFKKELLFHSIRMFSSLRLKKKLAFWAEKCELEVNAVRVKNHKSKWGSCSSLGNINLNYQLIFLEEWLIDYVIIHELMHLKEMNHSKKFWAHVEAFCPEYKRAVQQIKTKQWLIGILD